MVYIPKEWIDGQSTADAASLNNIEQGIVAAQDAALPTGGATGQIPAKVSPTDSDVAWVDLAASRVLVNTDAGVVGPDLQTALQDLHDRLKQAGAGADLTFN